MQKAPTDDFDDLRDCGHSMVVEALAAAFDLPDLTEIAAELDDLCQRFAPPATPAEGAS